MPETPDFPHYVHIENTNACPARCTICPMDSMTRKTGLMSFDFFERLITECARYPEVEQLHLHGFGEPLVDKAIARKVALAKGLGIPYTYIVTTANNLTEEFSESLIDAGLDGIKFSFYGMTAETYEQNHRRLKFERTVANIESFFQVRDRMRASTPRVRFQFSRDMAPVEEFDMFIRHWRPLMDADRGDKFLVTGLHNWAGGKDYSSSRLPEAERHCNWPFHDIQVLWDGRVAPCVFDYDGTMVLGDAKESSLYDIWHSDNYEKLRDEWRARRSYSIPLCANCDDPEGTFQPRSADKRHQPAARGVISKNPLRRLFRSL